jgi:hypothetical protein
MSAERVRVGAEWLSLREPADAAARSAELAERLGRHLSEAGHLVVHDLGGGSGAMGRWLAPRLPGPQHWVVHDRDAEPARSSRWPAPGPAADGAEVTVEARRSDIAELTPGDLAGAGLIAASALLDILTADELAAMLGAAPASGLSAAARAHRRRPRRADPAGPLDAASPQPSTPTSAAPRRGRLLGPDAHPGRRRAAPRDGRPS